MNLSILKAVHFGTPINALDFLEELLQNSAEGIVFRGEFDLYPTRRPSALRGDPRSALMYTTYSLNLARWLFENLLAPHLEHIDGPYYRGSFVGCQDMLGRASSDHGYAQSHWQIKALLQHYERKTHWLDLTFDPRAAMFFASFDSRAQAVCDDGVGYIYYAGYSEIPYDCWPLIDLQSTSELFAKIWASQRSGLGLRQRQH